MALTIWVLGHGPKSVQLLDPFLVILIRVLWVFGYPFASPVETMLGKING